MQVLSTFYNIFIFGLLVLYHEPQLWLIIGIIQEIYKTPEYNAHQKPSAGQGLAQKGNIVESINNCFLDIQ